MNDRWHGWSIGRESVRFTPVTQDSTGISQSLQQELVRDKTNLTKAVLFALSYVSAYIMVWATTRVGAPATVLPLCCQ